MANGREGDRQSFARLGVAKTEEFYTFVRVSHWLVGGLSFRLRLECFKIKSVALIQMDFCYGRNDQNSTLALNAIIRSFLTSHNPQRIYVYSFFHYSALKIVYKWFNNHMTYVMRKCPSAKMSTTKRNTNTSVVSACFIGHNKPRIPTLGPDSPLVDGTGYLYTHCLIYKRDACNCINVLCKCCQCLVQQKLNIQLKSSLWERRPQTAGIE